MPRSIVAIEETWHGPKPWEMSQDELDALPLLDIDPPLEQPELGYVWFTGSEGQRYRVVPIGKNDLGKVKT